MSARKWTNYSYVQGKVCLKRKGVGQNQKYRFSLTLGENNYPESYLSVGISPSIKANGRLPKESYMLSCLDGNFLSHATLNQYLAKKIEPGSQIDILVDMCEGTV